MKITKCDICQCVIRQGDTRYVNIMTPDEKPTMPEREVCVHCAEGIKDYIEGLPEGAK